jgi:hypothetical protein
MAQQSLTPAREKIVINMICLLAGALYFSLVVSHVFAVAILIVWVRLEKSTRLNLDVKNIFARSHTEHR